MPQDRTCWKPALRTLTLVSSFAASQVLTAADVLSWPSIESILSLQSCARCSAHPPSAVPEVGIGPIHLQADHPHYDRIVIQLRLWSWQPSTVLVRSGGCNEDQLDTLPPMVNSMCFSKAHKSTQSWRLFHPSINFEHSLPAYEA